MNKNIHGAGENLITSCMMTGKLKGFFLTLSTIAFDAHTGTEVIVLKAIPLTHCEDQVRYFATEKPGSAVMALATYGVNSVTGIVTVSSGVTDLRVGFKVRYKHCQQHTLSDFELIYVFAGQNTFSLCSMARVS